MPSYDYSANIPFTITTGGLGTDNLSAWTNELTRQQFEVTRNTLAASFPWVTRDRFVFDFGDGNSTTAKTFSASHIYKYPGIYTVSVFGFTSAGETVKSSQTLSVTAGDFIAPRLENATTLTNGQLVIKAGNKNNELKVNRFNSYQTEEPYANTSHTLTVHISGSTSKHVRAKDTLKFKWKHTEKTWSVYNKETADNGTAIYTETDSITSTNDNLYYKKDASGNYVRSLSSDSDSVFVGTSGLYTFYYKDDTPKAKDNFLPVILFATQEDKNIPEPEDIARGNNSATDNMHNIGRTKPVTIPLSVRFNPGTELLLTPSGMPEITFPSQKWERVEAPFVTTVLDSDGNNVLAFNNLSFSACNVDSYDNIATANMELDKVYLTFAKTATDTLTASFHPNTSDNVAASLNGVYRGSFIPYESTTTPVTAKYKARITNEAFFDADISFGVVGRSVAVSGDNQQSPLHLVPKVVIQNDISLGEETISTGTVNTFSVSSVSLTGEQFATAVAPESGSTTNKRGYIGDIRNDLIHIIDQDAQKLNVSPSLVTIDSPINLRNISILDDGDNLDLLTYSNNRLSASNSFTAIASGTMLTVVSDAANDNNTEIDNVIDTLGITSLAVDSEYNLWAALHDTNLVARYNTTLKKVDRLLTGPDRTSSTTYDLSSYTNNVTLSGFGGYNPEEPYALDCDKNDNLWVAYSNPLCAALKFFTINESANIFTLTKEVAMDPGTCITDIAVDSDNKAWFTTYDQVRTGSTHTHVLTASVVNNEFKFEASTTFLSANSAEIDVDKLFIVRGYFYDAKPFNGGYIIKTVADDKSSWTVHTHPDDFNSIGSNANAKYDVQFQFANSDTVGYVTNDPADTAVTKVSGFYNPSHLTFDNAKNVWVTHDVSTVEEVQDSVYTKGTRYQIDSTTLDPTSANTAIDYETKQYLTGLASDFSNRLWVINNHKRNIAFLPTRSIGLSSVSIIPNIIDNEYYQSVGDWTGYRWYNKYSNLGGTSVLSGSNTFTVNPTGGLYNLRKIGEDFDPSETIKSYRQQDFLKDFNIYFDDFIGGIVGTAGSDPNELGVKIYEKISNFLDNNVDIETCNIDKLHSISNMIDYKMDQYSYNFPSSIKRALDLLSISHSHLWGGTSKFDRDFDTQNTDRNTLATNLGDELSIATYIVSAGTPIVINQLFNDKYRKVNTMQVSLHSSLTANAVYDSSTKLYSQYPLSAYQEDWGWGINTTLTGTAISGYNDFYAYISTPKDTVINSVINWNDSYNTLSRTNSAIADWEADASGIIDLVLDHEIRKGLDLFQKSVSGSTV